MNETTRGEAAEELIKVNELLKGTSRMTIEAIDDLFKHKHQLEQNINEYDESKCEASQTKENEQEENLKKELNKINKEINSLPNLRGRLERLDKRREQIHAAFVDRINARVFGEESTNTKTAQAGSTFHEIANNLAKLLVLKEKNYGQSFNLSGEVLRLMAPNGIKPDQYDDVLTVVRIIDKLFRVMKGEPDKESPYQDIAGYSILKLVRESKT